MCRSEFPNPQFIRRDFEYLNGEWDFTIEGQNTQKIKVPFCPESALSGIQYTDFIKHCTYQKTFEIEKVEEDKRYFIHFGAVDYEAKVFVNGQCIGGHKGGYTPFALECTDCLKDGENVLIVYVTDDVHANTPSGKQSAKKDSYGCFYTRITGIWQNVWLEKTPKQYIKSVKFYPDINNASVEVEIRTEGSGNVRLEIFYEGRQVGKEIKYIDYRDCLKIDLTERHLWEPGNGQLYDVKIAFEQDEIESYFGMRSVAFEGYKFLINGKSVFQRFVLDQGYHPEGLYTMPSKESMIKDIELGLKLGFNGARLHQKVFDPQFLYYCDKMGYMIWGEFPSWGIRYDNLEALGCFVTEWTETVERDFNHPSIVLWCPLNETWKDWDNPKKSRDVRFIDAIYSLTKSIDKTRPCVDVSGGFHGHNTDLYDFHCYESFENLQSYLDKLEREDLLEVPLLYDERETHLHYKKGLPINVSEYGGIRFSDQYKEGDNGAPISECAVTCSESWGYGKGEADENAFIARYQKLTCLLLSSEKVSGFCYTQLYDIEQEENGFFKYDRTPKLSESAMNEIAQCNRMRAKIEED